jgi:enamine deaminase RidA (YjgF/YER057c/UK114 family)
MGRYAPDRVACDRSGGVLQDGMNIERIQPGPLMSAAVVHGNTVYLAGLIASDTDADTKGQTEQILARIDELLAAAGTDKSQLLRANIWLTDITEWSKMNEAWTAWVTPGATPARATVEARLAAPKATVEIMVEAARPA